MKLTQVEESDENNDLDNMHDRKVEVDRGKIGLVDEQKNASSERNEQKIAELKGKIYQDFKTLFTVNNEIKNFEYDVEFKENMEVFQQKSRRIPIHLQQAVEAELEKLQKERHLEKLEELGENACVSPAAVAQKSDGSIKIALGAKQKNCQKKIANA